MFSFVFNSCGNLLLQNIHHQTCWHLYGNIPQTIMFVKIKWRVSFDFRLLILNPKEFLSTTLNAWISEQDNAWVVLSLKTKSAIPNMTGISLQIAKFEEDPNIKKWLKCFNLKCHCLSEYVCNAVCVLGGGGDRVSVTYLGGARSCFVASSNVPTYVLPLHETFTTNKPTKQNNISMCASNVYTHFAPIIIQIHAEQETFF